MLIHVQPDGVFRFKNGIFFCQLGRNGVSHEKIEGDGCSPVGIWPLRRVLYRPDRLEEPTTGLPVTALRPYDGWCDDPRHGEYNQQVRLPHPASCESLWRDDRAYDVIVVLGYNDEPPVAGLGSAIFLHITKPERTPTEGCIALDPLDMLLFLSHCHPGDRLQIHAPY